MFKKPAVAVAAVVLVLAAAPTTLMANASPVDGYSAAARHQQRASSCASRELSEMSLEQRVGQLFIGAVDGDHPTDAELGMIGDLHLGGVILAGGSSAGADATREVSARVQAAATTDGVPLWVSADQEGGKVQHLKGPGFDAMPTALEQGALDPATLRSRAAGWGAQLAGAGVNLNLAPVLDTVPEELGTDNKPIGYYDREYGHTPETVDSHGAAFRAGMGDAGVTPAVKHFPGLGRVRDNTDTSKDVTDDVTTRDDAYLAPFRSAVADGAPMVMVSSARYTRIDPDDVAAFSSTVLTDMLRGDLGFTGVVVSDDLGAAAAVEDVPVGERALRFLTAGGTVVLSVDAAKLPAMVDAVLSRAQTDAAFRADVQTNAARVVAAKSGAGLLDCGAGASSTDRG